MSAPLWHLTDLLPHTLPMILLDRVLHSDHTSLTAEVVIRPDYPFFSPPGVSSHVAIEIMAQACGAHAGTLARLNGDPIRPGLLLGTRRFEACKAFFLPGETLTVTVSAVLIDQSVGVYDCALQCNGQPSASSRLTFFQPRHAQAWAQLLEANNG